MRHIILIFFAALSSAVFAQRPLDSLYQCLDEEIERFPEYVSMHEKEVALLTHELNQATDDELRYDLSFRLYDKYRAFINDSAIYYLNQCIGLAERLQQTSRAGECRSLLALRCSNAGMYDEAQEILQQIRPETLDRHALGIYYEAQNHVYNELAYYTHLEDMRVKYQEMADKYQEQLLAVVPDTFDVSFLRREMTDMTAGRYEQSKAINDEWLKHVTPGSHRYALVALYRYLEYKSVNDSTEMMYWLAESALSDVRNAVMDQGSLWELANQLMLQGNVDRSYRYITFTSDCAGRYGSRQRSWQIAPLLSAIANNYKKQSEHNSHRLQQTIIVISVMALLLLASLFYVNRQRKRLAATQKRQEKTNAMLANANELLHEKNQELSDVNSQLHALNAQLAESNRVKEEYVGRFMRLCSIYIEKMDTFRKRVNKMMKNHEYEELYNTTRSHDSKDQQLEELFGSFDAAFLHLFPNFVEEVNQLLKPDQRLALEKDKRMNTDLRILALIRLGIDDSSKIAEFLNYSVNTIYNYRARLKSNAIVDRDDFEQCVKEAGTPK
ncbi:MAG: transcriptional regulator [Prevotella sp.]|nr:transcriptional regulator [Prevotella sp.]